MPTVIDSLVINLGFNTTGLKSGQAAAKKGLDELTATANKTQKALTDALQKGADSKTITKLTQEAKAAKQQLKDVNEVLGVQGSAFASVAAKAVGFLAVLGGTAAISKFIEDTITSNAQLERFAKNLQTSVATISAWRNATELAGGSAGDLDQTLDMLSKEQTNLLLTGESRLIPFFNKLGVAMVDANGNAREGVEISKDFAQAAERYNRRDFNNMGSFFGFNQGYLNLLLKGRGEVERLVASQKKYAEQQEKFAPVAARLNVMMIEARQAFQLFGLELVSAVAPAIETVMGWFKRVSEWVKENSNFLENFFIILGGAIATYYTPAIVAAAAATLAAAAPFIALSAAIIGTAAALALLWDDYEVWQKGGKSAAPWEDWAPALEATANAMLRIKRFFDDVYYRAIAVADVLIGMATLDWKRIKYAVGEVLQGNGRSYATGEEAGATTPAAQAPARAGTPAKAAPAHKYDPIADGYANRRQEAGVTVAPTPAPQTGADGKLLPRGIRNNNPGNLNYARQDGATKEDGPGGRFAVFASMPEGTAAIFKQIGLYINRDGKNTIRKIISTYAPSSENDTNAYINAVSKATGIGPDAALDGNDAKQMISLVRAITNHENGKGYTSDADILKGYSLANGGKPAPSVLTGVPGALQAAQSAGAAPTAQASVAGNTSSTRTVDTKIDTINVITQAKDGAEVGRVIGDSIKGQMLTAQSTTGLF